MLVSPLPRPFTSPSHHRASEGAAEVRHRDPDYQAEPRARHPQALRAEGRGARCHLRPRGPLRAVPREAQARVATTETEVHQADIAAGELPPARELLASITNKVIERAKLPNRFAELYPSLRDYVGTRCFGQTLHLIDETLRSHLSRLELQEGVAKYFARKIAELTIERRAIEFDKTDYRLSETKPFSWRRNLPPLEAKKTVFNYVCTYNDYERRFAEFLTRRRAMCCVSRPLAPPSRANRLSVSEWTT